MNKKHIFKFLKRKNRYLIVALTDKECKDNELKYGDLVEIKKVMVKE